MTLMPLLTEIVNTSYSYPSEWVVKDVENNIYSVRFSSGKLVVRKDNKWTGDQIMSIEFPDAKWTHFISVEAMLAHTGFRTNHDNNDGEKNVEVHCG